MLAFVITVCVVSFGLAIPDTLSASNAVSKNTHYHFVMIGQSTDEAFSAQIHKGALQAASDYGAAVEFNDVHSSDIYSSNEIFDMAMASRVDGIAVQITDSKFDLSNFENAKQSGIPAVTFETDSVAIKNITTIGTNRFQAGYEAGKMAVDCMKGNANIAVILNGFYNSSESAATNLKYGMSDAFKNYPNMKFVVTQVTEGGVFDADKVTKDILNNHPEVNLIVATNELDTLGIAKVLVDNNRVGNPNVVGYGALPDTMRYIKSGVIYGTVVSDPYKIGYDSIKALVDIKESGYSSSYLATTVYTYTKENVDEYKETK